MATDRCIFLRPIEYVKTVASFHADIGAGAVAHLCTNGVYANVLTLWKNVEARIAHAGLTVDFTTDFKARITHAGAGALTITWDDTTLRDALGFTGDLAGLSTYTATYTPQYIWFPTYGRSDQGYYAIRAKETFAGQTARNGRVYGLSNSSPLYYLKFAFPLEPAENVYFSAAKTVYDDDRCLETFIEGSRSSWPTVSTNPAPHGFYYVHDYTDVLTPAATYTNGGVQFDISDTYVYCHFDSDTDATIDSALPRARLRYNVDFSAHTATAPTWTATGA